MSASPAAMSGGHSSVYSDLQGLQSIKQLGQVDEGAALTEVAKQFESILVNMMLKNMRSATNVFSEGSYLGGDQVNFYQEMLEMILYFFAVLVRMAQLIAIHLTLVKSFPCL